MRKTTTQEREKMILLKTQGSSLAEIARLTGFSVNTVKKVIEKERNLAEKCKEKQEEIAENMQAWLVERSTQAMSLLDKIIAEMSDDDRISKARYSELSTAFGVIIDKYTKNSIDVTHRIDPLNELPTELLRQIAEANDENSATDS